MEFHIAPLLVRHHCSRESASQQHAWEEEMSQSTINSLHDPGSQASVRPSNVDRSGLHNAVHERNRPERRDVYSVNCCCFVVVMPGFQDYTKTKPTPTPTDDKTNLRVRREKRNKERQPVILCDIQGECDDRKFLCFVCFPQALFYRGFRLAGVVRDR